MKLSDIIKKEKKISGQTSSQSMRIETVDELRGLATAIRLFTELFCTCLLSRYRK